MLDSSEARIPVLLWRVVYNSRKQNHWLAQLPIVSFAGDRLVTGVSHRIIITDKEHRLGDGRVPFSGACSRACARPCSCRLRPKPSESAFVLALDATTS